MLLTALAAATSRIGLIATASTTYNEPYNLARRFASLDHVSGGRAGWNIVTTAGADAAAQLRPRRPARAPRALRAGRRVPRGRLPKLWDSWEDDALVGDKAVRRAGATTTGSARIDHVGRHFRVRGPAQPAALAAGPPAARAGRLVGGRQGVRRPVRRGGLHRPADARRRAGVLRRPQAPRRPRSAATPTASRSCPGIVPVIGGTEAEARRARARARRADPPGVRRRPAGAHRSRCGPRTCRSTSSCPPTSPDEDEIEGAKSRYTLIVDLARREHLTVRAADRPARRRPRPPHVHRYAGAGRRRDRASGTTPAPPTASTSCRRCCRRGSRRSSTTSCRSCWCGAACSATEYEGTTLREHYGLARPANLYATTHPTTERTPA